MTIGAKRNGWSEMMLVTQMTTCETRNEAAVPARSVKRTAHGDTGSPPRSCQAYGYARVSTDRQIDGTSIDEQKRRIHGAAAMLGIGDPTIYSDQGVSGSIALGSRPQGQRLLAALQPGDTVFASKLDRMFRDATDALVQARALGEIGVNLILLDLGTDSVTAANGSGAGKLLFTCMAAFADFDRDRIRERSLEAKAALRARGLFPGGTPPYGFRVVKEGRFSRLVPDEYEQTVIKAARLFWDQGLAMKQILAALEARGFRNRAGNPFSSGPIYRWTVWSVDPDHVNISERTKAALARRKAAGEKLGNPDIRKISPLGVAAVMQNAAQRVAEVMPQIDDLIAAGVRGYREMARVLNASEIPSARGGRWYGSSVRNAMMAADRSFPAKTTAVPRCEHSNPTTPKIRIVRPATQKQRQAIRQQHQKVMVALAAPRLGPVQKQTAQILAYKAEGLSTAGIARVLGVSEPAVARILELAGLSGRRQTPHLRRQDAEREQILVLRTQGKNGEQIAKQLAIPVDRIYTAISRASALDPRFSLGKSHLTPDEYDQIATLRGQGLSIPEIARRCGRSERTVHRAIAKLEGINMVDNDDRAAAV
jgi:putative DNA-invertase from lambdoid prophage Rac